MYYYRLCKGLNDKGKLLPEDTNIFQATTRDTAWFRSVFLYNEQQKEHFEKTGSVAGMTDLVTNKIFIDLDSAEDISKAYEDTHKLLHKMSNELKIGPNKPIISFSGKKGFSVELDLEDYITPQQYKDIYFYLTDGLQTADKVVVNPGRVMRVLVTKHNESGNYKIPLTFDRFKSTSAEDIKELSKHIENIEPRELFQWDKVPVPKVPTLVVAPKVEQKSTLSQELDFSEKPKFLDAARWALQNGFFKEGERSVALTCLAATYKNLGFKLDHTYRLLKGVAAIQAERYNVERFSDEEIYNNVIMTVYGPNWRGGQYTLHDKTSWLYQYAAKNNLLDRIKRDDTNQPKTLLDVRDKFKDYVMNIDKNTIKTGIKSLDDNVFLSTGANVLLIGAAGSGKSSLALEILENTSKAGIKSVFASLDMTSTRIFEKVMYRITGMSRDTLYDTFKNNNESVLMSQLKERYSNTFFYDRSSPSVQDIRDYVLECEQQSGEKVKMVMIDYFERVSSDKSDDTAASKQIASEIQDMVNDLDICCITLVQPNKMSLGGDASNPITSYTSIKGSSFLYQSARVILSIWRPFYNIKHSENDKFMSLGVLKNDLGEIGQLDYKWDGKRGTIDELEDIERRELEDLLANKDGSNEESDENYVKRTTYGKRY